MNTIHKIYNHLQWRIRHTRKIAFPQFLLSSYLPKKIATGPFAGMNYLQKSVGSVVLPKLIGTYEDELWPMVEKIRNTAYELFIDIGAAEGYYAVGIKKFILPKARTIAFEAKQKGRNLIKQLANLNGVSDVIIKGFCNSEALSSVLHNERAFLLVDIEGGEYELLNPKIIDFSNCDLLIEIHYIAYKTENDLIQRFTDTHTATLIHKGEKRLPQNVEWHRTIKKYEHYVTNEFRGPQSWLVLESKKYVR